VASLLVELRIPTREQEGKPIANRRQIAGGDE
jgi:hypothetical protein